MESLRLERGGRTASVYWVLLILLLTVIAVLPWVRIELPIQAIGIIRPDGAHHLVRAPLSGVVETVWVQEDDTIKAGGPLLRFASDVIDEEIAHRFQRLSEIEAIERDLRAMLSAEAKLASHPWQTREQSLIYASHLAELDAASARSERALRALERARALHAGGLIPLADYEEALFASNQAATAHSLLLEQARARWETELAELKRERKRILLDKRRLEERLARHLVSAPVAGHVLGVNGLVRGQYLVEGEAFAQISPHGGLHLEVRLDPAAVGLPRSGMPVRIQVHAFPASEWGYLAGVVSSVAPDVQADEHGLRRRAVVRLEQDHLERTGGHRAPIEKGMTATVWFPGARRNLWEIFLKKGYSDDSSKQ